MRFMIIVRATAQSEAGVLPRPDEPLMQEMAAYHEELARAGVLLDGAGLRPSREGWRIHYQNGQGRVLDGPFAETKELIAGFWLWEVASLAECVEWVKRCPNPMPGDSEIEIRQVFEAEDFGAEFTLELREQEERLRARMAAE